MDTTPHAWTISYIERAVENHASLVEALREMLVSHSMDDIAGDARIRRARAMDLAHAALAKATA